MFDLPNGFDYEKDMAPYPFYSQNETSTEWSTGTFSFRRNFAGGVGV
jgi:hypothetical protein